MKCSNRREKKGETVLSVRGEVISRKKGTIRRRKRIRKTMAKKEARKTMSRNSGAFLGNGHPRNDLNAPPCKKRWE